MAENKEFKIECKIVEKVSKKGLPYEAVEITIGKGYTKLFFLNGAELYMLKNTLGIN